MNIVLIGYRGTGKTSIGRQLAAKLGRDFIDTDELIVARARMTIKEIFEREGEPGFRDREASAVAEMLRTGAGKERVIAVGGGAVLRSDNVAALRHSGKLVWLQADAATLHARIAADRATAANRPHLAGGGVAEVKKLLAAREPLYRAAADATLPVAGLTVEQAVERLISMI